MKWKKRKQCKTKKVQAQNTEELTRFYEAHALHGVTQIRVSRRINHRGHSGGVSYESETTVTVINNKYTHAY